MSGQIFISYRREDSAASAGRVYDRLNGRFPSNRIFIDVDNIAPGVDFVKAIEKSVGSCDVLISIVGKHWLTATDEDGKRRLDNTDDFIRLEIATALKRGIRVIPVLVDGALMPRSGDLPDELKSLIRLQALKVSQDRFRSDSEPLLTAVGQALKEARDERRKRGLTFPGKRTWLSVVGVVTVLSLVAIAAIYFSSHHSKPPTRELAVQPFAQPTAPIAVAIPTPSISVTPSPAASHGKQSPGQLTPSRGESPQEGVFRQETRVPGVVAELTRFVRTGNLITAEVALRNTGSDPVTLPCEGWQLIDEQTGHVSKPDIEGGIITESDISLHSVSRSNALNAAPLAPGATHVTWAKFKVEAGVLSGGNYAVNVESILSHPFDGLVLKATTPPQPSQQEARVPGVVAELTRFVRTGNLITAEVALRNTGSDPVTLPCEGWQLIDEQTGHVSKPNIEGGIITESDIALHSVSRSNALNAAPLAPGATHVTWAKFKVEAGVLSGGNYAVNVESILSHPFDGLVPKSQ
jgi:TIR domain